MPYSHALIRSLAHPSALSCGTTFYILHTTNSLHNASSNHSASLQQLDSLTPTLLAMFGAALAGALGSGGDAANFFRGMSADRYTNLHTPPMHCTAPHRSAPHSTTSQHRSIAAPIQRMAATQPYSTTMDYTNHFTRSAPHHTPLCCDTLHRSAFL